MGFLPYLAPGLGSGVLSGPLSDLGRLRPWKTVNGFMDTLLGQLVFCVGSEEYRWDDVILAAKLRGDWARLEKELCEGLACVKRMDEAEEEIDAGELESAANDFRYERDLVTAEEAEAWLKRWNLAAEDWMDYIHRYLLRRKWAGELAEIVARYRITRKEINSCLQTEAVCSGYLARFAQALAARASAFAKAREEAWIREAADSAKRIKRIRGLEAGYRSFCDHLVVDSQGLRDQVGWHRLDWIRFDCRYVLFPDEQMAREASLCVRDDGMQLGEVAANAKTGLHNATLYLEEIDPSLRDRFLSAGKGALVGPVNWDEGCALFVVDDKIPPALEDPAIKRRAEESLIQNAIDREISNRVKWHVQL